MAIAVVLVFIYNFKQQSPSVFTPVADSVTLPQIVNVSYGVPVRLSIPAIEVDAAFESVGITADGAMDMPDNINSIGWYDLGQKPGDIGSAVIAGHSGLKAADTEAFNNIDKLVLGDKVYVTDEMGNIITFLVRESKSFDSLADTSSVFISDDGRSHLNIITCDGIWNNETKSYSGRLVVFTDKE